MDPTKQMNDYWHIPRASLASAGNSSAASSIVSSSASSSATSAKRGRRSPNTKMPQQNANTINSKATATAASATSASTTSAAATAAAAAAVLAAAAKRGSRSSQGSSDSNNSTRSAASGSLLLTAANLERFAEIHKKQERQNKMLNDNDSNNMPNIHGKPKQQLATATEVTSTGATNYSTNLVHALAPCYNEQGDAIIPIDPNLKYVKTKDLDTVSIASSMHFTMVNGEGGSAKKPKRGLCDRGRQVTVLIVVMSTIFMLLIMGMVYALEMRARDMPKS